MKFNADGIASVIQKETEQYEQKIDVRDVESPAPGTSVVRGWKIELSDPHKLANAIEIDP